MAKSRISQKVFNKYFTPDNSVETEESFDPPRPFIEHFIDLRNMLFKMSIAWILCVILIAFFAPDILLLLKSPIEASAELQKVVHVEGLDATAGASILIQIMLWGGTILSMPFLTYFMLKFIFPGLHRHERNILITVLLTGVTLFSFGVWLAFSFTLQVGMEVLMAINNWIGVPVTTLRAEPYLALVFKTIVAFGASFLMPLVLLALGWIGLISSQTLREKRNIAIVGIFVIAMMLTPPEPVSQIIMAVPMCILYEACILLIRMKERLSSNDSDYPTEEV